MEGPRQGWGGGGDSYGDVVKDVVEPTPPSGDANALRSQTGRAQRALGGTTCWGQTFSEEKSVNSLSITGL